MLKPSPRRMRRLAVLVVVGIGVLYAPIAMTELWPYADPHAPAIGQKIMGWVVNPTYVANALATRIRPYQHSLVALVIHSVLGGLLMLLGPVQLISAIRRRTRLHRAAGIVFAVTLYACMAGAAIYLARTKPADAFSGPTFWIILATILFGTVLATSLGILAAVARRRDLHQRWMLITYAFLMTAPLLRLEWGALPLVWSGLSMAEINRLAVLHLGSIVVVGALLGSRALDRRRQLPGASWCPWPVLVVAHLGGAIGLVDIVRLLSGRELYAYLVPLGATFTLMWWRVVATRGWPREEWSLHLAGLCLAPTLSAAATPFFATSMGLDHHTAACAGVAVGCGVMSVLVTMVVSVRVTSTRVRTRPSTREARIALLNGADTVRVEGGNP